MRVLTSLVLYRIGDILSYLLKINWTSFIVYPVYNRVMLWSAHLDTEGRVWEHRKNYLNDLKVHMTGDSYRPYLDKYKHNQQLLDRKINKTK